MRYVRNVLRFSCARSFSFMENSDAQGRSRCSLLSAGTLIKMLPASNCDEMASNVRTLSGPTRLESHYPPRLPLHIEGTHNLQ